MTKLASLSMFFPSYNEEANIEKTIRTAQEILPTVADQWEIVPVNDGSSDRTGEIADRLARENSRVRPVHHKFNRGYGAALVSGFNASVYDVVFFTDGDLQFELREIPLLIKELENADLVLGYRKDRQDHIGRKLNGFLWGALVRAMFGFHVRDVDCAFKLIKREVLAKIDLSSSGALISTELLARSHRAGFRFAEVGVTHYPRLEGKPTGGNLSVIARAFRELPTLYRQMSRVGNRRQQTRA